MLQIGQEIQMPEPTGLGDCWAYPFAGTLADIVMKNGYEIAVVEDQDSDFFEIETERITDQGEQ